MPPSHTLMNIQLNKVDSIDDAFAFLRWLGETRLILAADTETKGLTWATSDPQFLRLMQFGDTRTGWVISAWKWRGLIEKALSSYEGPITFHNASFDLHVLLQAKLPIPTIDKIHDTMLIDALVHPERRHGLKSMASEDFGAQAGIGEQLLATSMKNGGWTWETIPEEAPAYGAYSALDPVLTAKEWELQYPQLGSMLKAYETEMLYRYHMTHAEHAGIRVDRAYMTGLERRWSADVANLRTELLAHGITKPLAKNQMLEQLLEDGWHPQEYTATGQPKLDREVLSALADDHEVARLLLDLRFKEKRLTSYVRKLLDNSAYDGRLHYEMRTLVARTHRSSVSNPPLQQLPKTYTVRRGLIADEGHKIWAVDYAAQEFRLAVAISEDPVAIEMLKSGEDIHCHVASKAYGETITKDDLRRQLAKNTLYAWTYNAKAKKIAATSGIAEADAQHLINVLDETFPVLSHWRTKITNDSMRMENMGQQAAVDLPEDRKVLLPPGRAYTTAINSIIQGAGAIVLKQAVNRLCSAGFRDNLLITVHDEALFQFPDDEETDDRIREVSQIMTDQQFAVELPVEVSGPATSWGALYEKTRTVEDTDF